MSAPRKISIGLLVEVTAALQAARTALMMAPGDVAWNAYSLVERAQATIHMEVAGLDKIDVEPSEEEPRP